MNSTPTKTPTPSQVDNLKRKARDIKKNEGVSHCIALNRCAQDLGYKDWPALMRDFNGGAQ